MKIRVTAEMIARSIPKDSQRCAIAQAMIEAGLLYPVIDLQTLAASDPKTRTRHFWKTPKAGIVALYTLDKFGPAALSPFTLNLNRPLFSRPMADRYTGSPAALKRARARYAQKKKLGLPTRGVARYREFGVRGLKELISATS